MTAHDRYSLRLRVNQNSHNKTLNKNKQQTKIQIFSNEHFRKNLQKLWTTKLKKFWINGAKTTGL